MNNKRTSQDRRGSFFVGSAKRILNGNFTVNGGNSNNLYTKNPDVKNI